MICPVCTHNNLPGAEQCANCLLDLTQLDQPTAQDRVERSLLEDRVGVLNRVFSVAYHVRLIGKRIKSRSKLAHYTLKWLIIGGLFYWIFS